MITNGAVGIAQPMQEGTLETDLLMAKEVNTSFIQWGGGWSEWVWLTVSGMDTVCP